MNDNQPEPLKPPEPRGEIGRQDPAHADDLEQAAEELAAEEPRTYEPSTVEVNGAREQGLGVGQKDIDDQRDATGAEGAEHYGQMGTDEGRREGSTDVEHGESRKVGVEQP